MSHTPTCDQEDPGHTHEPNHVEHEHTHTHTHEKGEADEHAHAH